MDETGCLPRTWLIWIPPISQFAHPALGAEFVHKVSRTQRRAMAAALRCAMRGVPRTASPFAEVGVELSSWSLVAVVANGVAG